ncbi:hypothetical protein [Aeromicrobium sp. 9AM]|uniref:hypothetical protein n=1 Tax=Aeromicrobium sp. 9AM TaxID=2653126 RepID=UPI0012EFB394|nr:hypothetical protein [Aeromicrobium sp. 9AM]VXB82896.1 exported hypothetical protein [Aeromicrobium sp. 9AM]
MKRILMVLALLAGTVFLATPASAETPPPAEDVTQVAETVVDAPAPEPVTTEPVVEPTAPVVEETPPPAEPIAKVDTKQPKTLTTTTPPEFEKYEVEICWTMDKSDGVEGTYEWPQTRSSTCTPAPTCGKVIEIQRDLYWIESQDDEDYLASLDVLNSPADDAQLSPHGYYSKVFTGPACDKPVTAAAPMFIDPTCDNNVQDYTVPTIEGIEWQRVEPREDIWPKIGLTAIAKDGYEVVGQDTFWHTYPALKTAAECNPVDHKPTDKGIGTPAALSEDTLPDTGAPAGGVAVLGALMVVAGLGTLRLLKRL